MRPRWLRRMAVRIARVYRVIRLRRWWWVAIGAVQREGRWRLCPARSRVSTTATMPMCMSIGRRTEIRGQGRRPRRHCLCEAAVLLNRRLPRRKVQGRSARLEWAGELSKLKLGIELSEN